MDREVRVDVVLPLHARGRLPFSPLHGEPLFAHSARAATALAGARPLLLVDDGDVDAVTGELARLHLAADVVAEPSWSPGPGPLLVHDPLCPLTPPDFLREVAARAADDPQVSCMAFRPVTDTVKLADGQRIRGTIDRDGLAHLSSPALLSGPLMERKDRPPLGDVTTLLSWMRAAGPVTLVRAPSMARRVDDESAVRVLECMDELAHRTRTEVGHPA